MKKLRVDLDKRSYDILIGSGVIKRFPSLLKAMRFTGPVVVVTDNIVHSRTHKVTDPVFKSMPNAFFRFLVPSSEKSKSLEVFQNTVHKISRKTRTHQPLIVALGGGVVGDLAGFIASTYRRGVPLVQIPTTLLAQVDSAIGGKVGVDLPEAKNLVGAFYQPAFVVMDTDFLRTLPCRQIRNGTAEIIKYAIIKDQGLFGYLEKNIEKILKLRKNDIEKIIYECACIKARLVEKDERDDKGIRIALNFGHTIGHAIEAASGYSRVYTHGEAISVGMLLAGEIAMQLDMLKEKDFKRIRALIKKARLPTRVRGVSLRDIMSSHKYDKKFITGYSRLVLPTKIGSVEIVEGIPWLLIKTVLRKYVL
ncbi:MAG: 3-dehydroquinate synthase [Candidatus Omnitrophota bacterium]|nr:3-dehydroquinate synthase [Candidatus Omnitrophota bacterium]